MPQREEMDTQEYTCGVGGNAQFELFSCLFETFLMVSVLDSEVATFSTVPFMLL